MRISDWSSDVCSSDLGPTRRAAMAGRSGTCRSLRGWFVRAGHPFDDARQILDAPHERGFITGRNLTAPNRQMERGFGFLQTVDGMADVVVPVHGLNAPSGGLGFLTTTEEGNVRFLLHAQHGSTVGPRSVYLIAFDDILMDCEVYPTSSGPAAMPASAPSPAPPR